MVVGLNPAKELSQRHIFFLTYVHLKEYSGELKSQKSNFAAIKTVS